MQQILIKGVNLYNLLRSQFLNFCTFDILITEMIDLIILLS